MSSCRSLALHLGLLGLLACAGCRLHFDSIRVGADWEPAEFFELRPGVDGRKEVLERFGPPNDLLYPLGEEVFFYRVGEHRGSNLQFLIPDPTVNIARPGLELAAPNRDEPEEFQDDAPPVRALQRVNGFLFGFFNPIATDEGAGLYGRRLRWNVIRLVLDRDTHVLKSVEILEAIDDLELVEMLNEAVLIDAEQPGDDPDA